MYTTYAWAPPLDPRWGSHGRPEPDNVRSGAGTRQTAATVSTTRARSSRPASDGGRGGGGGSTRRGRAGPRRREPGPRQRGEAGEEHRGQRRHERQPPGVAGHRRVRRRGRAGRGEVDGVRRPDRPGHHDREHLHEDDQPARRDGDPGHERRQAVAQQREHDGHPRDGRHALGDHEGAYVEHVGGGDRQGLAPDHALAVEAPGVDAEEQRGAARGQAGEQHHRPPLQSGDERDQTGADAEDHQAAAHADRAPHRPAVEAAQEGAVGGAPARLGHVACLVHARLHPQLLARRQPERPGGGSRAEHDARRPRAASSTERRAASARSAWSPRATSWGAPGRAARGRPRGGARRGATTTAPAPMRTTSTPRAVRRTPSTAQPTACPSAVAVRTQASTTSWAPRRFGRRHQSGDGEQAPHLHHPGEVDRGEQQRTEVLGDGTDRVDGRLAPRQQLAAAAAAHGGADRQQQEAGEGGAEVAPRAARARSNGAEPARRVDRDGHHGEDRGQQRAPRPGRGRRRRDGVRSARGTPSGDGCRAPPPARPRPGVSRGGHGRPRR